MILDEIRKMAKPCRPQSEYTSVTMRVLKTERETINNMASSFGLSKSKYLLYLHRVAVAEKAKESVKV